MGQLSCQGSAPCTTQVACGPRAPGRKAGLWPRVPAASGQEALSSSPPGHLGLCLFPAQASSKRHLSLQVGAGCLRRCESRRGGSRPGGRRHFSAGAKAFLPARGTSPPLLPSWSFAGVPQAGARLSFTHRPGPPLPWVTSGFVCGHFPFHRRGGLALPSETIPSDCVKGLGIRVGVAG